MEDAIKLNPDNFCRVCLSQSTNMAFLEQKYNDKYRTLADVLSFVVSTDIKIDTEFPKRICGDCETIMFKAEEFKQRCVESEKVLCDIFMSKATEWSITISNVKKETTRSKGDNPPHLPQYYDFSNVKDLNSMKCEKKIDFCGTNVARLRLKTAIKDELSEFSDDIADVNGDVDNKDGGSTSNCDSNDAFFNSGDFKIGIGALGTKVIINSKVTDKNKSTVLVKCEWCERQFKNDKSCKKHKTTCPHVPVIGNDFGYFQCSLCMRKFKKKNSLISHIKHHELRDRIKYVCSTCKREFKHQGHLDNHVVAMHNKDKGVTCEYCLSVFPTDEALEVHKKEHSDEKRHRCKVCNKAFNMLSTLTDHLRTHTGEKPFLCSVCGRGFSQKTNLGQHMRRHLGLKPFKCKECDRGFVSKGELDAHERKHSGAHPFVCTDCGNGFTTSSSLVKHRRIHTGERPYACDLCPMKFSASGTLKNHRRTHTGEKPYQCSYCEKAFVQRQDLVSHIRCHTGERPYVCSVCGQAFRKAAGLKTHVRMHKEHLDMAGVLTGVPGFEGS